MYENHPLFVPPNPLATLWRYMDFAKFVHVVDSSSLFFSRADLLGDPFEGTLPKANIETMDVRYLENQADMVRQALPFMHSMTIGHFVNCWHANEVESDAMWKIYAQQNAGVAIKTNFESLAKSFVTDETVYIGKVRYIDYGPNITDFEANLVSEGNSMGPLLAKRNHFQHEREIRAILSDRPPPGHQEPGRNVEVDLITLIHEVRVSPLAPAWVSELIASVLAKYDLQVPVGKSSLAEKP